MKKFNSIVFLFVIWLLCWRSEILFTLLGDLKDNLVLIRDILTFFLDFWPRMTLNKLDQLLATWKFLSFGGPLQLGFSLLRVKFEK